MGPGEGHFICGTARYRMVEAKVCLSVRAYSFLHILQVLPILLCLDPPVPSLPPLSSSCLSYTTSWMPQAGSRAGPRPQRGGLIGDRRGGPCEGGRPRGWPGLSRAQARTPPISEEPLRGAGGWGNRLLVVTDDDEVAVTGRICAPF